MDLLNKKLLKYCELGDLDKVKELADIHTNNELALRRAIERGHLAVVQHLISMNVNIRVVSGDLLLLAVMNDRLNIVRYLISKGITVAFYHEIVHYIYENGILNSNGHITLLKRESDKINFIKNDISKLIPIKQSRVLLNVNSFSGFINEFLIKIN